MNMVDLSALYAVCDRAVALATKAGMASCDNEDVVYVMRELDPRQITLIGERE